MCKGFKAHCLRVVPPGEKVHTCERNLIPLFMYSAYVNVYFGNLLGREKKKTPPFFLSSAPSPSPLPPPSPSPSYTSASSTVSATTPGATPHWHWHCHCATASGSATGTVLWQCQAVAVPPATASGTGSLLSVPVPLAVLAQLALGSATGWHLHQALLSSISAGNRPFVGNPDGHPPAAGG